MSATATVPVRSRPPESKPAGGRRALTITHLAWIPAAALIGWSTSFAFGDILNLPVDVYYAIYFSVVIGFFAYYVLRTGLDVRRCVSRRLAWATGLGVFGGVALMVGVLARPETVRLSGGMLVWAIAYRGVIYGSVDGLLLFAFPWIVVWRAFGAEGGAWSLRLRASAVAFVAMLLITTSYHLGYADFRSSKIVMPIVGSTIGAVPTLVTANPVASVIGHAVMHVTSVIHSPGSDLFLPPHRGPGGP